MDPLLDFFLLPVELVARWTVTAFLAVGCGVVGLAGAAVIGVVGLFAGGSAYATIGPTGGVGVAAAAVVAIAAWLAVCLWLGLPAIAGSLKPGPPGAK